jgi:hypothetical protein
MSLFPQWPEALSRCPWRLRARSAPGTRLGYALDAWELHLAAQEQDDRARVRDLAGVLDGEADREVRVAVAVDVGRRKDVAEPVAHRLLVQAGQVQRPLGDPLRAGAGSGVRAAEDAQFARPGLAVLRDPADVADDEIAVPVPVEVGDHPFAL